MTGVSVVVPWRPGCPEREQAWQYAQGWWSRQHPDWELVTGTGEPGPWCKATAVADGVARAAGRILVIADADVLCDCTAAVAAVVDGAPWAVPHYGVYRLTQAATAALYAGGPLPSPGAGRRSVARHISELHRGVLGGGIVVLPAALYPRVPLDARFTGWGQEDSAWGHALTVVAGRAWRGGAPLWHLWHPPQPRASRSVGSSAGLQLYRRYRSCYLEQEIMRVLAEPGARVPATAEPDTGHA